MIRSRGHCNTMGTASTMACVAEALGMTLPGRGRHPGARQPPAGARPRRRAADRGDGGERPAAEHGPHARVVPQRDRRARRDRRVHQRGRPPAGDRRARSGSPLTLDDFDASGAGCRCWSICSRPGGYLMEDFHRAGGLRAVLREVARPARRTGADGDRAAAHRRGWPTPRSSDETVIRRRGAPLLDEAGIAVLRGNLCPDGAVVKPAAASPALLRHRGPRGRVRQHRGPARAPGRPGPGRRRGQRAGAARLRAEGVPGHARGRQHAAAGQAARQGRTRHGADQRRPDERHRVRHRRAAHGTGVGGRRPAGQGPHRRHDRAGRARAGGSTWTCRRRIGGAGTGAGTSHAAPVRGWERLYVDHVLQADRAPIWTSSPGRAAARYAASRTEVLYRASRWGSRGRRTLLTRPRSGAVKAG